MAEERIILYKQSCPSCGSSDARQVYESGTSYCFSCDKFYKKGEADGEKEEYKKLPKIQSTEVLEYPIRGFEDRKIKKIVSEFFGVHCTYNEDGKIAEHYYPYGNNSYKVRKVATKEFYWVGRNTEQQLFGQNKFSGGGRRLIITEGELDAMSVAQACMDKYDGKIYPVVSVPSATALDPLIENREWIRTFDEVVLWFDSDEPGIKAREKALNIVGVDKAKYVDSKEFKDASDAYRGKGFKAVNGLVWDAMEYVPAGIVEKDELWERLKNFNNKVSVPFPRCLGGVNEKTKGHRGGEITLFVSGTGSGKSTLLREDMLHILQTTEDKIGIISLEESPEETARKLSGMAISKNPAKEEIDIDVLKVGFDKTFGTGKVILLDHQGSIKDESIIDKLEYMALKGCNYLYIDHITILVSEGAENLYGLEAQDKVMNDLLRLVKKYPDCWIGLISHLRKTKPGDKSFEQGEMPTLDDIKGSGSIKQISFDIVAFARDMTAESQKKRNTIKIAVLKSRFSGLTGAVRGAYYQYDTGRFIPVDEPNNDQDVIDVMGE